MNSWFKINNIEEIDSPALVIYPEKIKQNIALVKQLAGIVNKLRPHVKSNKITEVCQLMLDAGIVKFKCATIAEAEMLALINAPDVLLAYQPVGPKMQRLITLVKTYPQIKFSCLIDNIETAKQLANLCETNKLVLSVYIDLNIGMNRTGIVPEKAMELLMEIKDINALHIEGFHAYDGHIHETDLNLRTQQINDAYLPVEKPWQNTAELFTYPLKMIVGGTPTFPIHRHRDNVECSPGTFIFWDWGYKQLFPEEPFVYAALVITRVISIIDETTICIDLGHKALASESSLDKRIHFLNAPEAIPVTHSEEHMVLKVPMGNTYKIGDVLYGVPVHICPTVALYDDANVVENAAVVGKWKVVARSRFINI